MNLDPATSNADLYKVIFENERVRVLEYIDGPGESTTPHLHPDSVMYMLSSFKRRLVSSGGRLMSRSAPGQCGGSTRRNTLA